MAIPTHEFANVALMIRNYGLPSMPPDPVATADAEVTVWRFIATELADVTYDLDGARVRVRADWSVVLRRVELMAALSRVPMEEAIHQSEALEKALEIAMFVNVEGSVDHDGAHAVAIAARHVYNIYLMANVVSPGAFHAWGVTLADDPRFPEALALSGHLFEDVLHKNQTDGWPGFVSVTPSAAWSWLRSIGLGLSQISRTSTQRVLFALLHADQTPPAAPTSVLWLTHALESVFRTPTALSKNFVRDRAIAVLGVSEENVKRLREALNNIYKIRDSLVHGGFDFIHPVHQRAHWDEPTGHEFMRIAGAQADAAAIVVAAVRKLIAEEWEELHFSEVVLGRPIVVGPP